MFRRVLLQVMAVLLTGTLAVTALTGCGGKDAELTDSGFVTGIDYSYLNTTADYFSGTATCALLMDIHCSNVVTASAIDSVTVAEPSGTVWIIPGNSAGSTFSNGTVTVLLVGSSGQSLPIAGTWKAQINLKDGRFSAITTGLHEPGTLNPAVHKYVYSAEDWTPTLGQSDYVALLRRFPTPGVTFSFASGTITSSGYGTAESTFLPLESQAYNLRCWLYDANGTHVGETLWRYSTSDHSASPIVGGDGEWHITPAMLASGTSVDLSTVKFIRIVCVDGAQFQASSPGKYQARSLSLLIAVTP